MKAPAVNLDVSGVLGIVAVVAVVGLGVYAYARRKKIGTALNPLSDKNVAYKGVNSLGAAITGDKDFSLGTWLYNVTHASPDPGGATDVIDRATRDDVAALGGYVTSSSVVIGPIAPSAPASPYDQGFIL